MELNRDKLLKIAMQVRPALSSQPYIPALSHIRFSGGDATAYNDVSAITVDAGCDLEVCVPGELLIRALQSLNAEKVLVTQKNGSLLLSAGRAKLKLPVLEVADFPFKVPQGDEDQDPIRLSAEIMEGIQRCLFSVGTDTTQPAQLGVTLDQQNGKAVLYSTDNVTISSYATNSKIKLPGDVPIILPTFFCEQMLSLWKAISPEKGVELWQLDGALSAVIGPNAELITKTLVDVEPMDFQKVMDKFLGDGAITKSLKDIPTSFDSAMGRALLVLGGEMDKATHITSTDGESLLLSSTAPTGTSDDELEFVCRKGTDFYVDPSMVSRGLKGCDRMALLPKVLVLSALDGAFLHLIAHCSKV